MQANTLWKYLSKTEPQKYLDTHNNLWMGQDYKF